MFTAYIPVMQATSSCKNKKFLSESEIGKQKSK